MKYYYLLNNEKVGPLKIDQLRKAKLNEETLIWYSGLDKWKKLKNVTELSDIINQKNETKYFILENNEKIGPFYLENLKDKNIQPKTLVWTMELDGWTKAREINDLEDFIMPPIPEKEFEKTIDKKIKITKEVNFNNAENSDAYTQHKEEKNNKNEVNSQSSKYINLKFVNNEGSYFRRPLSHKGRIERGEYISILIIFIIAYAFLGSLQDEYFFNYDTADDSLIFIILFLYIFIYYFAIVNTAKRCHDVGKSGWWQLIPFYVLYLIFAPGENKDNEWGNKP